ncbi:polysaccharide lyase 8 family protein [Arthrobacter sp. 35W]|uniref:polysaccharide lyase 8 family protein n=1 Tax=Arthrobacter sp. 35W TaxID=1132441 RepID=UPI00040C8282|nr:polysaccharide lyase 8 family protein [Arthrobacter sp. 35W]
MNIALTRRQLLQGGVAASLLTALGAGFAPLAQAATTATDADLLALRERWVDQTTGRTVVSASDPDFAATLARLDTAVAASLALLVPGGARTKVFSDTDFAVDAQIVTVYKRLAQMATAWATPGSAYLRDEALLADIRAGLADGHRLVYNAGQAEYGNWWSWEIGTPKALTDTMAILGDQLDATEIANYCAAVDHFIPDPTMQFPDSRGKILSEGANRVDICQAIIIRSIVGQDTARLSAAIAALSPVWQYVTSGNGFFADGSFVQHSTIGYTGTYGVVLLGGLAKLFSLLGGSPHAVADPTRSILFDAVESSFAPFIHDGAMLDSVRGRAISRTQERSYDDGAMAIEAILWLARAVDSTTAARWSSLCQGWIQRSTYKSPTAGATIPRTALLKELLAAGAPAAAEPVGHKFFAGMDRSVYRSEGWAVALGLSSRRMTWYECGNGENNTGYNTGSGLTYLYTGDGGHFDDDFWPTANLNRLPGTTVDTTPLKPKVEGEWGAKTPQNEWTGGATLEDYGVVGMHLVAPGGTGMKARKSWFFLPDMVVALGSDIRTNSGKSVESIIEHRNLGPTGGNALVVDGAAVQTEAGAASVHAGPQWAHLDGVAGYLFLDGASVTVLRENRTGSWKDINTGGTAAPTTRQYATLLVDHGRSPAQGSYAYAVLPGATAETTAKASTKDRPTVLRNDAAAQGIASGKLTAATFWQPATVGSIAAGGPACVLAWQTPGVLKLAVSDPTQSAASVVLTITGTKFTRVDSGSGATLVRAGNGDVVVTIPTAGLAGASVELKLHK